VNAHGRAYNAEMMNRIEIIRARELNPSASVAKLDEAGTDDWSEQLACFDDYMYEQTGTAENGLRAHAAADVMVMGTLTAPTCTMGPGGYVATL
jgi:hypothetical protein